MGVTPKTWYELIVGLDGHGEKTLNLNQQAPPT